MRQINAKARVSVSNMAGTCKIPSKTKPVPGQKRFTKIQLLKLIEKGEKRVFEAIGKSMDNGTKDSICHGDKFVTAKVERSIWVDCLLAFRKDKLDFTLKFNDGGIATRRVNSYNDVAQSIWVDALNPNKNLYPTLEVSLEDIVDIYLVMTVYHNRKYRPS